MEYFGTAEPNDNRCEGDIVKDTAKPNRDQRKIVITPGYRYTRIVISKFYCTPNLWKKVTRYPTVLFSHWNTWGCVDSLAYKLPASTS
jgi:hypothetical protein